MKKQYMITVKTNSFYDSNVLSGIAAMIKQEDIARTMPIKSVALNADEAYIIVETELTDFARTILTSAFREYTIEEAAAVNQTNLTKQTISIFAGLNKDAGDEAFYSVLSMLRGFYPATALVGFDKAKDTGVIRTDKTYHIYTQNLDVEKLRDNVMLHCVLNFAVIETTEKVSEITNEAIKPKRKHAAQTFINATAMMTVPTALIYSAFVLSSLPTPAYIWVVWAMLHVAGFCAGFGKFIYFALTGISHDEEIRPNP